mmetsp:Transcript_22369/g.63461  ORF Transcript_22369/g.63461 Transcript_22369/m.63461 type:complete len:267 (+) Transcript_22369:813-1613(+)
MQERLPAGAAPDGRQQRPLELPAPRLPHAGQRGATGAGAGAEVGRHGVQRPGEGLQQDALLLPIGRAVLREGGGVVGRVQGGMRARSARPRGHERRPVDVRQAGPSHWRGLVARDLPVLLLDHPGLWLRARADQSPASSRGWHFRVRRVRPVLYWLRRARRRRFRPSGQHPVPRGRGGHQQGRHGGQHQAFPQRLGGGEQRRSLVESRLDGESGPRCRATTRQASCPTQAAHWQQFVHCQLRQTWNGTHDVRVCGGIFLPGDADLL